MKKPVFIEPFQIVRARRIRNERLRRLCLGLAFGAVVFLGLGGLAGCAASDEEYYRADPLTLADLRGLVRVEFMDRQAVEETCAPARRPGDFADACATWSGHAPCLVRIAPPASPREADVIAFARAFEHELKHCKGGHFHD